MTAPLVGVVGKKRAGKDTFAGFLVEGHGFARVAFADPLKAAALRLDPLIPNAHRRVPGVEEPFVIGAERLSAVVARVGWEKAKEIVEVRRTLQEYGVAIREIAPSFWVDAGMAQVDSLRAAGTPVVVTDVRFPNEADAIEAAGGVLVRVVRPGVVSTDTHASEVALDDRPTPYLVRNDVEGGTTLDDVERAADTLAAFLA